MAECRSLGVTPHVAPNTTNRRSAIDGRATRHAGHRSSQRIRARAVARLRTARELREALTDDRFRLLYQPLVSLDEHVVVGMEALLRWDHPERGSLQASEFLAVTDGAGLSVAIGTWALGEAFRQAAEWQVGEHLRMHVNVSARQLGPELVALVRGALAVSGADPGGICLEFAETALTADVSMASPVLRDLKELGACLSIDDFGVPGRRGWPTSTRFPSTR